MIVSAAPPVAPLANGEATYVVDAPLGLRLRSGPSLVDAIILVLYNGESVQVVSEPVWAQGIRWVQVEVTRNGTVYTGWCASAYLANYPGYDEPYDGYGGELGYKVTASIGLRLRSGPGLGYWVERIVPYGTVLEPTGSGTVWADGLEWRELTLNGETVWAAAMYLEQVP